MNEINFDSINRDLSIWVSSPSVTGKKDEAKEKIKKAFETHASRLDLSSLRLNKLPSCIGKLTTLKDLCLFDNDLEFLPDELGQLPDLEEMNLTYNRNLQDLPDSLSKISTLFCILNGGTGISNQRKMEILNKTRVLAIQEKSVSEKDQFDPKSLLFSERPPEVQQEIDRVYQKLSQCGTTWGHAGTIGFYNLLNFEDGDVIAQRIEKASPKKKDLYFIDLGAGHFSWVDEVYYFLRRNYQDSDHHFHVLGVTGEGDPFDNKKKEGNITTHKISGFKLENLLESFAQFELQLVGSVEFIATSWTLQHLVDPIGTLEQAYHLLNQGNGFLFGTGFYAGGDIASTLSDAFGIHSYIARKRDSQPDDFALFRSDEGKYSYAKKVFSYDEFNPIMKITDRMDCFSNCWANVKPKSYKNHLDQPFGGGFHGFSPYVLEQLLGQEEKTFSHEGKHFKMPLFKYGHHFCKMYLDSSWTYKCKEKQTNQ